MRKINVIYTVLLCLAVFTLSACNTTGSSRPWIYNPDNAPKAKQPPEPLSQTLPGVTREPLNQHAPLQGSTQIDDGVNIGFDTQRMPTDEQQNYEDPQYAAVQPEQTVKVGLLLPLSGQHKNLGQAMLKAAQLALFDVGHTQFELMPRDTKGTPEGAREAARSALQDNAELILGPVFATSVKAAAQETNRSGVNMIAYSTDWGLAGDNVFIMGFLPFDQVHRIVQYAAYNNLKNIAVIAPETDYGNVVTAAYQAYADQYGLNTVKVLKFPPTATNLSPTLRDFTEYDSRKTYVESQNRQNPNGPQIDMMDLDVPFDAVMMPVGGNLAVSISNLLSHYDLPPSKVKRLGTGLFDDPALAAEDSMKGAWFAAPSPELRRVFEQQYKESYGVTPPRLASLAYDSTALAAVLAKRGLQGGYRAAYDYRSISNPNGFSGIDGIFRFRSDGTADRGLAVLTFKNGRVSIQEGAPSTFEEFAPF